jgi:hypothetical protein
MKIAMVRRHPLMTADEGCVGGDGDKGGTSGKEVEVSWIVRILDPSPYAMMMQDCDVLDAQTSLALTSHRHMRCGGRTMNSLGREDRNGPALADGHPSDRQ